MEKDNAAIIEELRSTICRIREELETVEERLSEILSDSPEPENKIEEAFDITLDDTLQSREESPEPVEADSVPAPDQVEETVDSDLEKPVEVVFEQAAEEAPKVFFESVMPDTLQWKRDVPGTPVQNILSAISLNDRVQFINILFGGDPILFQNTIHIFNGFSSLAEVENHIAANFPKWKQDSDVVYRFMMAVRRKLN